MFRCDYIATVGPVGGGFPVSICSWYMIVCAMCRQTNRHHLHLAVLAEIGGWISVRVEMCILLVEVRSFICLFGGGLYRQRG